ncbi:MAG: dTMP kinase [Sphingopyxis sp.]
MPLTPPARGRFITLEGGEGVGKSTQLAALATALRARGINVVETREPGGSDGAEAIRELLLHQAADAWSPRAEALLFAAARSDHLARTILPALERGDWVLCDRFLDSSRAYQGGSAGLSDDDVMTLHRIGSNGILPDRTLLLMVDRGEADARRRSRQAGQGATGAARPDRFEDRQAAFHDGVASAFARMAQADPARFRQVDAQGAAGDITARLIDALADWL